MNWKRNFFVFLALLFLAPGAAAETLDAASAQRQVRETIDKLKDIVSTNKDRLSPQEIDDQIRDILLPVFDFEAMSKSSLGTNWKKASAAQQQDFVSVFSQLLCSSYLSKIRKSLESSVVSYLPAQVNDDRVVVRTKVKAEGETISIDYRAYQKDEKWRVYDVVIENVGLVSNYRSEFNSMLEKESFDSVLAKLRERANANADKAAK